MNIQEKKNLNHLVTKVHERAFLDLLYNVNRIEISSLEGPSNTRGYHIAAQLPCRSKFATAHDASPFLR